jgi:molybdopterin adenylyltransferase
MAKVKAVCISDRKGQPKTPVESVELKTNLGVVGDAHANSDTHRQVSFLDEDSIEIMRAKGYDAVDGDFGENLVTSGLAIDEIGIGTVLQVGKQAKLKISQIGKSCHSPCAIGQRTGECIMPTEGIFGVVLKDGIVGAGDEIQIETLISRQTIQAAVITVSDRCSRGETQDASGPALARILIESLKAHIAAQEIIPDEKDLIANRLKQLSEPERYIDLIFTTGGTGFAPRDVTPEATALIIEREAPGFAEAIRQQSLSLTPKAMLSRAVAGIRNRTLIVNLPGSVKAIQESLEVILPVLDHAVELLRGEPTDCGRLL